MTIQKSDVNESPQARRDRLRAAFVDAHKKHEQNPGSSPAPTIEAFLAQVSDDEHGDLLTVLVLEEIPRRWERGELPTLSDFVRRFPANDRPLEQAFFTKPEDGGVHFALLKELGHGGAGRVYLARDNELGRHVAVKVLYGTSLGDAKQQAQFEKELQIAAKLNHDNIVDIFHTGRFSNNHRYAVMKYIEGDTLDARLRTMTFTPVECIELLLPVIQAVQYAHEKGLVAHRDLKPANILLDGNNKPHVSDFGLAVTSESDNGGEVGIAGSPPYMAPEQIVGDEPTASCDIWSLGVVLYEMLTRKRPFEGGNRQRLFDKIRFNEPTFPSVACPEAQIDDELDRICLRCLEKKPEKRFQRAEELGEELAEWLERRRERYEVKVWKGIKPFRKMLDKEQNAKIKKAADEAKSDGQIKTLKRVAVRQSSLPNLELYDLGSIFRLVVLLVGGARMTRVFLYCGSDDDCQAWLVDHKNYVWIEKDGDLDFVQVSEADPKQAPLIDQDLTYPDSVLALPLLRDLTDSQWTMIGLPSPVEKRLRELTATDLEENQTEILGYLAERCPTPRHANLILDLLVQAHRHEFGSLGKRIDLFVGNATVLTGAQLAKAVDKPANSELFVNWDELVDLPLDGEWVDWMLFLHPEQKALAGKDFNGPARLRGVSGSGKTCVMIHRAKYLARKYHQRILLVTLTISMRNLLESLLLKLCGAEIGLIDIRTVSGLAKDIVLEFDKKPGWRFEDDSRSAVVIDILRKTVNHLQNHPKYSTSQLSKLDQYELKDFLMDEIVYVRGRLQPSDYDTYLSGKTFERRGRGRSLSEEARSVCLDAIRFYDSELERNKAQDPEAAVQAALELIKKEGLSSNACRWRCVLVDEVQDLSQLEVSMLASILTPESEKIAQASDGLFLVGDGAQKVYKRGFRLAQSGVNVSNRVYAFKKNYRNTKEILTAAYGLIQAYEFADVDEDNIVKPMEPEFAARHGEKPVLVKCDDRDEESRLVANLIHKILEETKQACQICVIAANQDVRDRIASALDSVRVSRAWLKDDSSLTSDVVKISTIESAKGHEFTHVFIPGLQERILPREVTDHELPREAARFYVAMTRARDNLYLSYTSNQYLVPSRFLVPIQGDCTELVWNGYTLDEQG